MNFQYQEPTVIERDKKYAGYNFKVEKPIFFDRRQRDNLDMRGVRSEPDLFHRNELYNPLKVDQLTKPTRAEGMNVITGNEFMKRDLGLGSYHKESNGAIFKMSEFDEALKSF